MCGKGEKSLGEETVRGAGTLLISELQGKEGERNLMPSGAYQHLSPVAEMAGGCSQWFLGREEKEVTVWQTWWFTGLGK